MFLPLSEAPVEPLYQTAIVETLEIATPKPPEPEVKELTLEEKIKTNHYKCDETRQFIRRDNAQCLDKPIQAVESVVNARTTNLPTKPQTAVRNAPSSSPSLSWWASGNCTWYVASKRPVGYWNDASSWLWQAQRDGWSTGSTPRVGAIAWEPGHVSLVIAVNGSTITVSEMNYKGYGVVSTRTAPASQFKFIY